MEEISLPLVSGTGTYTLGADTIDIVDHVMRLNNGVTATQSDISISRISIPRYSGIPNKLIQGRPVQVMVNRQGAAPTVTMWPVPNSSDYTFVYWRLRRMEDVGSAGVNTYDIPARFIPALVAGLAYNIAMKKPEAAPRIPLLKSQYDESLLLATGEDRDKTSLRVIPRF